MVSVPTKTLAQTVKVQGPGDGGTPTWKRQRHLLSNLRVKILEFWPHLGCSQEKANILAIKVSFRAACEEI